MDGAAFNVLIPLPGTPLMNYLLKNNFLALEEIKWDYLFARSIKGEHFDYSARLASRWCELSSKEIIQFCDEGTKMFEK
ncbi:MAG: hypothetical protein HYU63_08345 [Armatimonadetes bacterium]|nr:hypothetical protein [Armatimonadota bacterium]